MPRIKPKQKKPPGYEIAISYVRSQNKPPRVHDRRATELPKDAMVVPVEIDCPVQHGDKIIAFRSLRDNPLARLRAHDNIDQAQYDAGLHWQNAYERAEIGGARAIDPTREAVDGGRFHEPISDAKSKAYDTLWEARRGLIKELGVEMGRFAEALIRDVLGDRLFLRQAAIRRGLSTDWQIRALTEKFKQYLNILAVVYGKAMKGSRSCQNG